jgi:shikimate dehydrogenase
MVDALREAGAGAGGTIAVLGGGGTARAALCAARELDAARVTVYTRRPEAAEDLRPVADALGVLLDTAPWGAVAAADVVISTVPAGADGLDLDLSGRPVVFDVVYHPWPTPLAATAAAAGCPTVSGLDLLLAQGVRQFELFTGVAAPVAAMAAALRAATAA